MPESELSQNWAQLESNITNSTFLENRAKMWPHSSTAVLFCGIDPKQKGKYKLNTVIYEFVIVPSSDPSLQYLCSPGRS